MHAWTASHPSPEQLSAYALGKLDDADTAAVHQHLEACDTCREAAASIPPDSFVGLVRSARGTVGVSTSTPLPVVTQGLTAVQADRPASPPDVVIDLPPELAGHAKFRIVRELGRGGMGVVYQAEHCLMKRPVAIKVLNPRLLDNPSSLERFHQEVEAAAQLDHANIVRAFDAEQAGTLHLLVMEYVEGQSLAQLLERDGPLPIAQACQFVQQAARGLAHAHEKKMIHRDIKPQNLMLTPQGMVKILDFGLARIAERPREKGLTAESVVMGTPEFIAPEQATDARQADIRSDIYSLGCTLYTLLAGHPPFQGATAMLIILAHLESEAPRLDQVRLDVPAELAAVVAKMMERDPADRYQTPTELLAALAPFCEPGPKADPRPALRAQKVGRWPLVAAGLLFLVGISAVGVVIIVRDPQGNKSAQIELPAGGTVRVTPPPGGTVEVMNDGKRISEGPAKPQAKDIDRALAALLAKAKDPANKSEKLRDEIVDFCLKHRGMPAAYQAGLLLPELPPLTNSIGMKLAPVPPGKFTMGSPLEEPGRNKDGREGPQHEVEISRPFFMGVHEVTVGQFREFVKATRHKTDAEKKGGAERLYPNGSWRRDPKANWQNPGFDQTDAHPVVCIRWDDAHAFCAWLSEKEQRTYRLPTEAEWEYACRAGTTTRFYSGNDDLDLKGVANVADASLTRKVPNAGRCVPWDDGFAYTAPVGSFRPNAFGLYDMHGNAWEWCQDRFDIDYYRRSPKQDPPGPSRGGVHILRGGAWFDSINNCRAADRHYNLVHSSCHANMGFRVVLLPTGPPSPRERNPEPEAFLGSRPLEHANQVTCCQFSPDGRLLASGGKDGVVKLWDAATGAELTTLIQREAVGNLTFSPDGATLASWSKRGAPPGKPAEWRVKFWNVATGKELSNWPGFPELIGPVAFSPDGKTVATGGLNHTIKLWDFSTGKALESLTGHTADITCLAFSPDGKQLASGSQACVMKLWNLSDKREVLSLREEGQQSAWCPWIHCTVFSRDGRFLVVGMGANVLVYDLSASMRCWKLRKHMWAGFSVVLSTDDRYVLSAGSAGDGNHFVISDTATGNSIRSVPAWRSYRDGYRGAEAIALSPNGRILASAGPDHTVKIWDTATWREVEAQPASTPPATRP